MNRLREHSPEVWERWALRAPTTRLAPRSRGTSGHSRGHRSDRPAQSDDDTAVEVHIANGRDAPPSVRLPSCQGLIVGSDPAAEGRMGMHIATLPDADRGMPRGGVAPVHGRGARIGIGAPLAVVQPQ